MAKPAITKRVTKAAALSYSELDTNFQNLADATITLTAGSGGTAVVSDLNGNITLVAGTGVTLTGNNTAKTITINTAGTGTVNSGVDKRIPFYSGTGTTLDDSDLSLQVTDGKVQIKDENGLGIRLDFAATAPAVSKIEGTTTNITSTVFGGGKTVIVNLFDGILDLEASTAINLSSDQVVVGRGSSIDSVLKSPNGSKLILGSGSSDGAITINSGANGNIELTPAGTGDVLLNADTVRVGDNNVNAVITTQGTGDLTLNTNTGTNSGSITIADGANGAITIDTDGTGFIKMGGDVDLLTGVIGSSVSNTSIELEPNGTGVIYLNGPLETNTTTGTPVDDTAPTSWLKITVGTTDYFLPLYE